MEARVVRISVAPIKSFGLVHPDEVMLQEGGVVGNRRFWLCDEQGALYAGKRDGALLRIRPAWDESTRRLALTFPDGGRVEGIVELGDAVDARLYRQPRPSHRVVGPWEEAISSYVGRRLTFLWADADAVNGDIGRCVVTSRDPDRGVIDTPTLAALVVYRPEGRTEHLPFGIYGTVLVPGRVLVGDAVTPGTSVLTGSV